MEDKHRCGQLYCNVLLAAHTDQRDGATLSVRFICFLKSPEGKEKKKKHPKMFIRSWVFVTFLSVLSMFLDYFTNLFF